MNLSKKPSLPSRIDGLPLSLRDHSVSGDSAETMPMSIQRPPIQLTHMWTWLGLAEGRKKRGRHAPSGQRRLCGRWRVSKPAERCPAAGGGARAGAIVTDALPAAGPASASAAAGGGSGSGAAPGGARQDYDVPAGNLERDAVLEAQPIDDGLWNCALVAPPLVIV